MAPTPQSKRNLQAGPRATLLSSDATVTAACDDQSATLKQRTPPFATPLNEQHSHSFRKPLHAPEHAPNSNSTSSTLSPGTPFRFEAFPASLPRVHPRKESCLELNLYEDEESRFHSQQECYESEGRSHPQHFEKIHRKTPFQSPLRNKQSASSQSRRRSIQKRMIFAEPDFSHEEEYTYSRSLSNTQKDMFHDSYRDDSHNTSISSLSVDGTLPHHHQLGKHSMSETPSRNCPDSVPKVVSKTPFHSLHGSLKVNGNASDRYGSGMVASGTTSRAVWLSPILSDEKQKSVMTAKIGYSQGVGQNLEVVQSNPRTKLNFNSLFSPATSDGGGGNGGVSDRVRSVAKKRNSFLDYDQSPHDDATPARKMVDRKQKDLPISFTPSISDTLSTPHETLAPFQIGVSDINQTNNNKYSPLDEKFLFYLDTTQVSPIKSVPEDQTLRIPAEMEMDVDKTPTDHHKTDSCFQSPSHSTVVSTQSGQYSTSTINKSRKLRPMPDMSAFDPNITFSSTQHPEFLGDVGSESTTSCRLPMSPKKALCPPTPLRRTPGWSNKKGIERQDSLVSNKVLAACPSQVIDELSYLEKSLLVDEKGTKSFTSYIPQNNSTSLMHSLLEDDEEQSPKMLLPNSSTSDTDFTVRQTSRSQFKPISSDSSCDGIEPHFPTPRKNAKHPRLSADFHQPSVSFHGDFDKISALGSGAFADVYKARSKSDNKFYALKRNKLQFKGRRDRDHALTEIRIMHRLQTQSLSEWREASEKCKSTYCLYILRFIRAWQENGHLYSQTELCCRDTCRHLMLNLTTYWEAASKTYPSLIQNLEKEDKISNSCACTEPIERLVPDNTIWKICHDVACGLSHIHSHNIVHHDIKPLNIFFVYHLNLGALCKIGDFGMAGEIGTCEDGQEGDQGYMPKELLENAEKDPSGDIFSLGITLYELASSGSWSVPTEGNRWHAIRDISHIPEIPKRRTAIMLNLIKRMISPNKEDRPNADKILAENLFMSEAAIQADKFLADYIRDVDNVDAARERKASYLQLQQANQRQTPTPMQNRQNPDTERL